MIIKSSNIGLIVQMMTLVQTALLSRGALRSQVFNCRHVRNPCRTIICSTNSYQQQSSGEQKNVDGKPDLRRAARNNRPVQVITAACFLALMYMYPMILKPMFGIGEDSGEDQKEKIKQMGIELEKHRPSNMPEWKSPFAPKSERSN